MRHTMLRCAACVLLTTVAAVEVGAKPQPAVGALIASTKIVAPGEFEPQEYIWLSWRDEGFLGTAPFADVAADVMKVITPYVKIRLMYSDEQPPYVSERRSPSGGGAGGPASSRQRVSICARRTLLSPQPYGAFRTRTILSQTAKRAGACRLSLRRSSDPRMSQDRVIAAILACRPYVRTISEGGARQSTAADLLLSKRWSALVIQSSVWSRSKRSTRGSMGRPM